MAVEDLFGDHEAVLLTVPVATKADDRRRMLVHMVAEAAHNLMENPGADPEAVTITTHVQEDTLVVTATAPIQTTPPELG